MAVRIWFPFLIVYLTVTTTSAEVYLTGCHFDYNSEDCVHRVMCVDYTDLTNEDDFIASENNCQNSISLNDYEGVYEPVHIVYIRTLSNDNDDDTYNIIWLNNDFPVSDLIIEMDISNNQFKNHPVLSSMPNLKFLNVSHNELTTAILSNTIQLFNLKQIDFSFNRITDIEVNSNEYVYYNLEVLDLSFNALYTIPGAIFNSFQKLEVLNLSYNRITALNILDFEGISRLLSLQLDYNELIDINSSLLKFRDLQKLSIRGNKLINLLKTDFQNFVILEDLDLSCNNISSVEKKTFDKMTALKNLNLSRNALDVIDKESFKYSFHLKSVDLSSNKLKHLPIKMFDGGSVSFFSVQDNVLEGELETGTFYGLNDTKTLNISNQYLSSIEDDAFNGLNSVETLLLFNNKIIYLSKGSFQSLHSLVELDLSNNLIVNIDFDKKFMTQLQYLFLKGNIINNIEREDFSYLSNLQSCDLSNNNITYIKDNTFKDLVMLRSLQISHNPLTAIEIGTFGELTKLPNIDISFSKISLLKNNTFQHLKLLMYINVSHSNIAELQYNAFIGIKNVLTINLSHNKLTNFAVNTTNLEHLHSLILNNNYLTEISNDSLKKLINLFNLNLSHNNLKKVHDEAFVDQKYLRELDISYNPLLVYNLPESALNNLRTLNVSGDVSYIRFSRMNGSELIDLVFSHAKLQNVTSILLKNFRNLTDLKLNDNEIAGVNKEAFNRVEFLQQLDLSYNKIEYIQPGAFKSNRDLRSLNVSHNFLTAINYGTLHGLVGLSILDLSFNYIDGLEKEKLNEVENLETLIIDNNHIHDINYSEFQETSLSTLSIGDNPIPCKQIYELKQKIHVNITALKRDEHHENIGGITCNKHYSQPKGKQSIDENEYTAKVVNVLKKLMSNATTNCERCYNNSTFNDEKVLENREVYSNISQLIQKSSTDVLKEFSQLNDAVISTNYLLGRLLKVLATMNLTIQPITEVKENGTSNDTILYLKKVKKDLVDTIMNKESILAEVDNKINLAMVKKQPMQEKITVGERKPAEGNVTFTEICMALILTILVGLLIFQTYKWYKGSSVWTRAPTTLSNHQINEMENSNL